MLSKSVVCLQIPMAIKFFLYFGLYWTLPHDRIEEVEDTGGGAGLTHLSLGYTIENLLELCILLPAASRP